jgi:hypothetical protein
MVEISHTYKKGKRLIFPPESTRRMSTPKILTRSQTRSLPKDTTIEKVQGELEQSPRHAFESPFHKFEEERPNEQKMCDHGDKSNT